MMIQALPLHCQGQGLDTWSSAIHRASLAPRAHRTDKQAEETGGEEEGEKLIMELIMETLQAAERSD